MHAHEESTTESPVDILPSPDGVGQREISPRRATAGTLVSTLTLAGGVICLALITVGRTSAKSVCCRRFTPLLLHPPRRLVLGLPCCTGDPSFPRSNLCRGCPLPHAAYRQGLYRGQCTCRYIRRMTPAMASLSRCSKPLVPSSAPVPVRCCSPPVAGMVSRVFHCIHDEPAADVPKGLSQYLRVVPWFLWCDRPTSVEPRCPHQSQPGPHGWP